VSTVTAGPVGGFKALNSHVHDSLIATIR
jgi:hypothetical protein